MITVGIKELKNRLSEYLRRVANGERVIVTARGRAVAMLVGLDEGRIAQQAWRLVREGLASWGGGKPLGSADPPTPRMGTVADAVLEDRR